MCTNMGGNKGSEYSRSESVTPKVSELTVMSPVKLEGTKEQIAEIEKVRMDVLRHYINESRVSLNSYNPETSAKQVGDILNAAKQGQNKVDEYIRDHDIPETSIRKLISSIKRLNDLSQISSAEWWIKNPDKYFRK